MRVVITVFHSFVSRNLLYGPLLPSLAKAGIVPVLLVPTLKEKHFAEMFGQQAEVIGVDVDRLVQRPHNVRLQRLSFLLIRSHYLWYKQVERREGAGVRGWAKYLLERLTVLILAHAWVRPFFRALFARLSDLGPLPDLLRGLDPALVVSTDVFNPADYLVLRAAQAQGIKTLAMVRSWDNCYSKGLLPVLPETLVTNTHILADEAHTLHGMPRNAIEVIGLPQMDSFFNPPPFDRAAFMRSIGADPTDKLILFAPGGNVLTDIDWQTCDILRRAIDGGAINHPVRVLVRNHPHHPADFSRFGSHPRFIVEHPGLTMDGNTKNTELLPQDQSHLRETLLAADVVLWVATTLGIDAAALDRPEIMVNFDGYEQLPYHRSVRKYHDEDHMRKLVSTGGAHVVRNESELVEWINKYLDDPALDAEKRKKIVGTQLVYTDGKAGERFAKAIISSVY